MNNFLRQTGLIQSFEFDLNISKQEFIQKFQNQVDPGGFGLFSSSFEEFQSSSNKFIGEVSFESFKVRIRQSFKNGQIMGVAEGAIRSRENGTRIHGSINGFPPIMYAFYGLACIPYVHFFSSIGDGNFSVDLFILGHMLILFGGPYFIMKRGVKIMKQELECEFHFVVSKANNKL